MARKKGKGKGNRRPRKPQGMKILGRTLKTKLAIAGAVSVAVGKAIVGALPKDKKWAQKLARVPHFLGLTLAGYFLKSDDLFSAGAGALATELLIEGGTAAIGQKK